HRAHVGLGVAQPGGQGAPARAVDGDDDPHQPPPGVGTTDSRAPSATAARVAATSARSMTSSSAVPAVPIIESSRVTVTTVAEATGMRGVSYSPRSTCGAAQTSTTVPVVTAAGTSPALRRPIVVVAARAGSPTALRGTSSPASTVRTAIIPGWSVAGAAYASPVWPSATSTTRRSSAATA